MEFKHGNIKLLNIDCMEYMATLPDKYFDLAIVDPPYGIGASKGTWGSSNLGTVKNYGKKQWDNKAPDKEYFFELDRVSKNMIIWGANHFIDNMKFPLSSPCWLVWDKENSGDFADCELAWTNYKTAVRKFSFMWNGMLQGDMKNKEIRIHPTQKPRKLYDWLLTNYAKPDQKILDTHLGSGSSAIAAHYFGVSEFVGCELDQDYFKASVDRFKIETSQEALF